MYRNGWKTKNLNIRCSKFDQTFVICPSCRSVCTRWYSILNNDSALLYNKWTCASGRCSCFEHRLLEVIWCKNTELLCLVCSVTPVYTAGTLPGNFGEAGKTESWTVLLHWLWWTWCCKAPGTPLVEYMLPICSSKNFTNAARLTHSSREISKFLLLHHPFTLNYTMDWRESLLLSRTRKYEWGNFRVRAYRRIVNGHVNLLKSPKPEIFLIITKTTINPYTRVSLNGPG